MAGDELDISSLKLSEIIDGPAIQSLMEDFYKLAHIPMSIIDLKGNMLVGVGWQDICAQFHRAHPQTCKHCVESDTQLSVGVAPGQFRLYKCKNHMWDIATPILIAGGPVGHIFSGQFFFAGEPVDRELFRAQARQYGFDEEQYLSALDRVPRLSHQAVDIGMDFFVKLAAMLSQLGYANAKMARALAERKRIESLLVRERQNLQTIFDVVNVGMLLIDENGGVKRLNDTVSRWIGKQMTSCMGLQPGDVMGCVHALADAAGCGKTVHCESCPIRGTFESVLQTGESVHGVEAESRLLIDGEEMHLWLEVSADPLMLDGGRHVILALNNITARKLVEEQIRLAKEASEHSAAELARSNQDLEQFAYVASHDLQEPLRMVASFVELLRKRYKDKPLDAQAMEFIDFSIDGAKRMQVMINDLLAYSRLGTRGRSLAVTDTLACLHTALANLEMSIEKSDAAISHAPLPRVLGDETQLTQLFQNLLGNALKFRSDRKPVIHVGVEANDGHWTFHVRDNGIGIDPQYSERIFKVFQRLHTRDQYPGSGIGLAICKKIVERHGGRIWFESQPGEGTTFFFTVPSAQQ